MLVSACSKPSGGTDPNNNNQGGKKAAVGGEVVYDAPDEPDTLAPFWLTSAYAASITDKVYGHGLLRIGFDGKPQPALAAEMPTVSEDKKTYTFKMRQGVKWHDGKPVTAKDVEFTYGVLMHEDYAGPNTDAVDYVKSVKATDDNTVVFETKEVFAPFLFGVPMEYIIPMHIYKDVQVKDMEKSDLWKKPVGAGPWKFVEWNPGQYVLLERYADHWEAGKSGVSGGSVGPFVEKIRMKVIPEDATAIAALESGELTFKGSVSATNVPRLVQDHSDKLTKYDWDRMGYGYQTFNNDAFPTNIKEVRQALSYGLNRQAIISGLMNGLASLPPGFVPPIHWAYDSKITGYTFDAKKAEELIQSAGFKKNANGIYEKDGKPLKLKYVATKGTPLIDGIALQSQKDWKAIGVDVELDMVEFNTLLTKLKAGDYHVTFSGLGFSTDPHYSFDAYHSKNIRLDASGVNTGTNRARYKNAQVDALIDKGRVTFDLEERKKIYQEAQKLIVDDAPANWIYVNKYSDFARKDLKGVVNWNGYGIDVLLLQQQWFLTEK